MPIALVDRCASLKADVQPNVELPTRAWSRMILLRSAATTARSWSRTYVAPLTKFPWVRRRDLTCAVSPSSAHQDWQPRGLGNDFWRRLQTESGPGSITHGRSELPSPTSGGTEEWFRFRPTAWPQLHQRHFVSLACSCGHRSVHQDLLGHRCELSKIHIEKTEVNGQVLLRVS